MSFSLIYPSGCVNNMLSEIDDFITKKLSRITNAIHTYSLYIYELMQVFVSHQRKKTGCNSMVFLKYMIHGSAN